MCLDNVWIAACIMGSCLFHLVKIDSVMRFFKQWYVQIVALVSVWFIIQRSESTSTYFIDAIASIVLLLIFFSNKVFQKFLNNKLLSSLGKYSMEMFLIHPAVYSVIGKRFFNFLISNIGIDINVSWLLTWGFCLVLIIILAFPVKKIISFITNRIDILCHIINQYSKKVSLKNNNLS